MGLSVVVSGVGVGLSVAVCSVDVSRSVGEGVSEATGGEK
jgi:hypothetical protein